MILTNADRLDFLLTSQANKLLEAWGSRPCLVMATHFLIIPNCLCAWWDIKGLAMHGVMKFLGQLRSQDFHTALFRALQIPKQPAINKELSQVAQEAGMAKEESKGRSLIGVSPHQNSSRCWARAMVSTSHLPFICPDRLKAAQVTLLLAFMLVGQCWFSTVYSHQTAAWHLTTIKYRR